MSPQVGLEGLESMPHRPVMAVPTMIHTHMIHSRADHISVNERDLNLLNGYT